MATTPLAPGVADGEGRLVGADPFTSLLVALGGVLLLAVVGLVVALSL